MTIARADTSRSNPASSRRPRSGSIAVSIQSIRR
jgi:hypothetical protein